MFTRLQEICSKNRKEQISTPSFAVHRHLFGHMTPICHHHSSRLGSEHRNEVNRIAAETSQELVLFEEYSSTSAKKNCPWLDKRQRKCASPVKLKAVALALEILNACFSLQLRLNIPSIGTLNHPLWLFIVKILLLRLAPVIIFIILVDNLVVKVPIFAPHKP